MGTATRAQGACMATCAYMYMQWNMVMATCVHGGHAQPHVCTVGTHGHACAHMYKQC